MTIVDALMVEYYEAVHEYEHKARTKGELKVVFETIIRMARRIPASDMDSLDRVNLEEMLELLRRRQFATGILPGKNGGR